MSSRAPKRTHALIAMGTVAGVAIGVTPALVAHADESTTPKNIIVLISDGAGYNQFDAANLYEAGTSYGQVTVDPATGAVEHAESTATQIFESYPVQVGQSHYAANGRASYIPEEAWGSFGWVASGATDSAAAGTALGTGVKTNNGMLGLTPGGDRLLTVGEQAQAVGKKVGLVTSVPFNHATPAGFIAHNSNRNDYHGLATEMIDSGVDVMMGGGHPNFTDAHTSRASHFGSGSWISQADWQRVTTGGTDYTFMDSRADFEALAAGTVSPEKVLGIAQVAETLQYNRPGLANNSVLPWTDRLNDVPSLETMTRGALNVLDSDEGFFLMVEGGAVDWAGHANQTTRIIEEQLDFNAAAAAVDEWVEANSSWDETLVIVTADHETGYLAGPGAGASTGWTPMTGEAGQLPQVSWHSGGHTNALVPLWAKGAGAEILEARADKWDLVRGAYLDNTDIGKTIFDLIGHAETTEDGSVGVEADVPLVQPDGTLSMSIGGTKRVELEGGEGSFAGLLPEVTVTDTRTEAQARGAGWTVSGAASEFVAGNRSFGAENLAWTPSIVATDSGAQAGPEATLEAPVALADADRVSRVGSTVVGAALALTVPAEAESGRYASELTLTLFAKD